MEGWRATRVGLGDSLQDPSLRMLPYPIARSGGDLAYSFRPYVGCTMHGRDGSRAPVRCCALLDRTILRFTWHTRLGRVVTGVIAKSVLIR